MRRLQRVDAIQAETPYLLLSKEKDKRRFCSQGDKIAKGTKILDKALRWVKPQRYLKYLAIIPSCLPFTIGHPVTGWARTILVIGYYSNKGSI